MSAKIHRRRRSIAIITIGLMLAVTMFAQVNLANETTFTNTSGDNRNTSQTATNLEQPLALESLEKLAVKDRAPKTGYSRSEFGKGWAKWQKCDTRQRILARDLVNVVLDSDDCTVLSGTLNDPYTGKVIEFKRGPGTSNAVQIDHVVALSDAWQKGAQELDAE
ncbi:MAG: HNH endonuclease family protein, partial [Candidatus Nomurabacteria bacterium]|nr:HNH endonuclease family protein [Candidatus Nomurabacteria bacterium]